MNAYYTRLEVVVSGMGHQRQVAASDGNDLLTEVLARHGCLLTTPLTDHMTTWRWADVAPDYIFTAELIAGTKVFPPPGQPGPEPPGQPRPELRDGAATAPSANPSEAAATSPIEACQYPETLKDRDATILVYGREIDQAAQHLRAGNSVMIICEKMVVDHLWEEIAGRAGLSPDNPFHEAAAAAEQSADATAIPNPAADLAARYDQVTAPASSYRRQLFGRIRDRMRTGTPGTLLVLPHLDLFVGTGQSELALTVEAREFTDLLYPTAPSADRTESDRPQLLAFADPSLTLPEVVTQLFVRLRVEGCHRTVLDSQQGELPLAEAVVTAAEHDAFEFDERTFQKHVAGMNPVRVRQAMRYAHERFPQGGGSMNDLRDALRDFKDAASAGFEQPSETWDDIGGYDDVKTRLQEAVQLIEGSQGPRAKDYLGLAPRGFVFHGPPGTGKTLFAKAVARALEASVMVVSGPEVNGMWHGESEGRIRDLFSQARRNAPSVLIFDEFDAIAQARSELPTSSRAGNAVVAQILTEMDGFRPDVIMLVIATTNRFDILDPALLRPSRFHAIEIELPNPSARTAILSYYNRQHGTDLHPELLKALTAFSDGWNGDMLQEIFRQAHRLKLLKHGEGWTPSVEEVAEIAGRVSLTLPSIHKKEGR